MIRLHSRFAVAAIAAAALLFGMSGTLRAAPRVVASIMPVHALVAGVMAGIGAPDLVVRGAGSPHTYVLRPSEARALSEARVVFWIGPIYESFLEKPLAALSDRARVVELARAPGVRVLPVRRGGAWETHDHDRDGSDDHPHGGHDSPEPGEEIDGHLFLDPENAKAIARTAAAVLGEVDPGNAARYRANAEDVIARLDALDGELQAALAPVRARPFVVFHDAYQYFERRYGLNAVGSITVSAERQPGARRLQQLRSKISRLGAVCVFSEPQFAPALVQTVIERTQARTGVLDPLGAAALPGPDAYFAMMRSLGRSLTGCLAG
ncbi:MAG TPA: zinc ABC transporter substrate-binding protein [Alphaproteobacteria bacterium]